jgi:hypothetical protein
VVPHKDRAKSFSDATIEALNDRFPDLRVVVLDGVDAGQKKAESRIWTFLAYLLGEQKNKDR